VRCGTSQLLWEGAFKTAGGNRDGARYRPPNFILSFALQHDWNIEVTTTIQCITHSKAGLLKKHRFQTSKSNHKFQNISKFPPKLTESFYEDRIINDEWETLTTHNWHISKETLRDGILTLIICLLLPKHVSN